MDSLTWVPKKIWMRSVAMQVRTTPYIPGRVGYSWLLSLNRNKYTSTPTISIANSIWTVTVQVVRLVDTTMEPNHPCKITVTSTINEKKKMEGLTSRTTLR